MGRRIWDVDVAGSNPVTPTSYSWEAYGDRQRISLNWGLLWEHDAPFPNDTYIITAINQLRVVGFGNELDCGPICGPGDGMIRCATLRNAPQRALRAIGTDPSLGRVTTYPGASFPPNDLAL